MRFCISLWRRFLKAFYVQSDWFLSVELNKTCNRLYAFAEKTGRIDGLTLGFPLLLSLSSSIEANRKAYYDALKAGQVSNEITQWLIYFTDVILKAQDDIQDLIDFTLKKTRLFDLYGAQVNERQLKVIKRMLTEGISGFDGGMTAKKYMRIARTSKPTATRDLQKLFEMGALKITGGGRSTSYQIQFPE